MILDNNNSITVSGEIVRVQFEKDEFRILKILLSDKSIISVVGNCPKYNIGETVTVTGKVEDTKKYGKQIKIENIYADNSNISDDGLANSLCGLVYGFGYAKAIRLINHLGGAKKFIEKFDSIKVENIEHEFPGESIIKFIMFSELCHKWIETKSERQIDAELASFELTPGLRNKLRAFYGLKAVQIVKDDPYRITFEVDGIGFKIADEIALKTGVHFDSDKRMDAAVIYCINEASINNGHTLVDFDDIKKSLRELFFNRSVPKQFIKNEEKCISESINRLQSSDKIIYNSFDGTVSLKMIFEYESRIAADMARLLAGATMAPPMARSAAIAPPGAAHGPSLTDEQLAAVDAVEKKCLVIITGGPGVGKTTTCRAIVDSAIESGLNILLCAPTARAAKRLSESTGQHAVTIHRALEPQGASGRFIRNGDNKINTDLILVDESSMIDSFLMCSLVQSVKNGCRLVLVGDVNQLPPVGAGAPFRDIIESGKFPVVRLTKIHRQAEGSAIVIGSHSVLNGKKPKFSITGERKDGCMHMVKSSSADASDIALKVLFSVSSELNTDPRDVIVLSPMRKGDAGVNNLNKCIQEVLNPQSNEKQELLVGTNDNERILRIGDKVRQTKNDYNRGIVNGDIGKICFIEERKMLKDEIVLKVEFDGIGEVGYTKEQLNNLVLSYCVTIHSVQGSEAPVIILILCKSHYIMLTRTLLYTAITRAKRACIIVGDEQAVYIAASNSKDQKRKTALSNILKEM